MTRGGSGGTKSVSAGTSSYSPSRGWSWPTSLVALSRQTQGPHNRTAATDDVWGGPGNLTRSFLTADDPQTMQTSHAGPEAPGRSTRPHRGAKVVWTLVPIVTLGLAAAVPFVVAAVKGVVKPGLAVGYVVGEIVIIGVAMAISPSADDSNPFAGFLLVLLIITAATHTALLDNEKITIGK